MDVAPRHGDDRGGTLTPEEWLRGQFPDLTDIAALARGGQKFVFSARHPVDGDVVVKVIMPGQDVERVKREILAVQKTNSPRVPKILDMGLVPLNASMSIWLREQRVVGVSVRQSLSNGPFGPSDVAHLVLHILEALADAEQVRIVHRDVKPENLMRGHDGAYWLLDFGIARHLDLQSITQTAALMGPSTLGYAPPEQHRNQKREIDARADLFALAVTAVECLTGHNPFRHGARDAVEIMRRVEGDAARCPDYRG